MLISKFDLYRHEWLELVFENRNKGYGAYDLRQHYAGNMVRAMAITFSGITLLFGASIVFHSHETVVQHPVIDVVTPVTITPPQIAHPKPVNPELPKPLQHQAAGPTVQHIPPIVVPDDQSRGQMKPNDALTIDIGPTDTKGTPGGTNIPPETPGNGPATPPENTKIYTAGGVDEMPEPNGGEAAWSKFLSRNLRYPEQAQDEHVSGKSFISFVVEKDGHLSNFVIERPAGYGFDEEAVRVLKLAKAWKPGKQNGQPVRVKYIIPINFQISE